MSVHNQFGDGSLDVVKPDTLCVPSEKTDLGPLREPDQEDEGSSLEE